jgi:hypothetical protein
MSDALNRVHAAYVETDAISRLRLPYVFGGGHDSTFTPSGSPVPGYDCSGFASRVFHQAGILGIPHVWFPFNTQAFANWGWPGPGKWLTLWVVNTPKQEHCFLDFHLNDPRYPKQYAQAAHPGTIVGWMGADTTGFTPRHWTGT